MPGPRATNLRALTLRALLILLAVWPCLAQRENTFLIVSTECPVEPRERDLTGFRVLQPMPDLRSGIITALHGVAGCHVRALTDGSVTLGKELRIQAVSIDSDLALLYSNELGALPPAGYRIPPRIDWSHAAGNKLMFWGHPWAITLKNTEVTVRNPALEALATFLKSHPKREQFLSRASPSGKLNVVSLDGQAVAGDSGAPVVSLDGKQLFAVISGGIAGGMAGINWAVPVDQVDWKATDEAPRYREICLLSTDGLFDFDPTPKVTLATRLYDAASAGDDKRLASLLREQSLTAQDKDSALSAAARHGHDRCLVMLLDAGADPNLTHKGYYSRSILDGAIRGGYASTVDLILKLPSIRIPPDALLTATEAVVFRGVDSQLLRRVAGLRGIAVNAQSEVEQETALFMAVDKRRPEIVRFLLGLRYIDPNIPDFLGNSPADMACLNGDVESLRLIRRAGGMNFRFHCNDKR
jgi:hypothetical protein